MKRILFTFALALGVAGCLGSYTGTPGEPGGGGAADMAQHTGTGGNGGGGGAGGGGGTAGGGGGGGGSHDNSFDMAGQHPVEDLAGVTPGTAAFGATCTTNTDCQSLLCAQFVMGTVHRCTAYCGANVAPGGSDPTNCPSPPSTGTCTNATQPYCKFNQ